MGRLIGFVASAFGILLVLYAVIRLFNIDPQPIILGTARILGGGRLVEFSEAFSTGFDPTVRVCAVDRVDTDGDGFREWLVFYQSDPVRAKNWRQPCPDKSPRQGAIYDNDRGKPAIVFPYSLTPPKEERLGEQGVHYETAEIIPNRSDTDSPIEELLVYGQLGGVNNQLTIFKFQPNTLPSDTPTDDPPRYPILGAFKGTGGVKFDPSSSRKRVTVLDNSPFGRSQLAVKNVYELQGLGVDASYMDPPGSKNLAAPVSSSIDFSFGPPEDIFTSQFPEIIVLGFFQSLDRSKDVDWKSEDFLVPLPANDENTDKTIGNATRNYRAGNLAYFFLSDPQAPLNRNDISDLAVTVLQYFPEVEQNPTNSTIEGQKPQRGRVNIQIESPKISTGLMVYEMVFRNGEWKINQRLQ